MTPFCIRLLNISWPIKLPLKVIKFPTDGMHSSPSLDNLSNKNSYCCEFNSMLCLICAYTSHLPHIAAYALLNTLKEFDQDDLSDFSGGGLGEFLRLVSSSPEMWADIFSMNEKNIALAIDELIKSLSILKDKLGNDSQSLQDFLSELKDFKESNY